MSFTMVELESNLIAPAVTCSVCDEAVDGRGYVVWSTTLTSVGVIFTACSQAHADELTVASREAHGSGAALPIGAYLATLCLALDIDPADFSSSTEPVQVSFGPPSVEPGERRTISLRAWRMVRGPR